MYRLKYTFVCAQGDKNKRDTSGPNEIVSCTNCGPNPCTHAANNGCATEVSIHVYFFWKQPWFKSQVDILNVYIKMKK